VVPTSSTVKAAEKGLKAQAADEIMVLGFLVDLLNTLFATASAEEAPLFEAIESQAVLRYSAPNTDAVIYSAKVDASVCRTKYKDESLDIVEVKRGATAGVTNQWRKQVTAELLAFLAGRTKGMSEEERYVPTPWGGDWKERRSCVSC
jgi:hypothetical protein